MLTLFYSPHMTSVDNEAGRASGYADVPLSVSGQKLAQGLGQHYVSETLDAIFCSDLQRAALTAQIAFSGRDLPLVLDARLRECDYGDWTQQPFVHVEKERLRRITEPFPHGESVLIVVQRVGAFLLDTLHSYDGKTIVVIGHGATRWAIEYWCHDTSLEEIVHTPGEWREVPIWRYELHLQDFEVRSRLLVIALQSLETP
jgi:broad specificity phosphatase PhoE